jgi:RHS repeat-associated protein
VRLSYSDTNNDGVITASSNPSTNEIIEESNYYPFGLKHKGYNNVTSSNGNSVAQKYGFTGKEHQDELGLGWIDITARNYDPALGRWMNLDPLAEQGRRWSPYTYAFDNPIYFQDPDGMWPNPFKEIKRGVKQWVSNTGKSIKTNLKRVKKTVVNAIETTRDASRTVSEGAGYVEMAMGIAIISSGGTAGPVASSIIAGAEVVSTVADAISLTSSAILMDEKGAKADLISLGLPAISKPLSKLGKKVATEEIYDAKIVKSIEAGVEFVTKTLEKPIEYVLNNTQIIPGKPKDKEKQNE